jgi:fructokinase
MTNSIYGGIEAGGTKFSCIVASDPNRILAEDRFPTTTPAETIGRAVDFLRPFALRGDLAGVGIGSFGPVDLHPASPTFGSLLSTPKPGWSNVDIFHRVKDALGIPVAFDTDVNAAAFGEYYWSEGNPRFDPLVYITVGTGIGVGVIANGAPLHGLVHPEGGHMRIPHDRTRDPFEGSCPFHLDCVEGLASGPAMAKRWGQSAETLPEDHPGWELEAEYLGYTVANLICVYSPLRVLLGGGVSQHDGLIPRVRRHCGRLLNGYIRSPAVLEGIDRYILPATLGSRAGTLGCIAMARAAGQTTG